MNPWNVIGHDWAVRRLAQSIDAGQVAQSHLFIGPPSVGKTTLAQAFAGVLLSSGAPDSRDSERARSLAADRKHPDLAWIEPQDGSIKVEQVRELLHTLILAPVESRYRVAVVVDAQLVTDSGQNAILKTLEEPNPSVVMVLLAPGADSILPTIVSRCQVLALRPVATRDIQAALLARGVEAEKAHLVAHLARGRVGWALRAAADEELLARRRQSLDELQALLAASRTQRFAYAEAMAKQDPETVQAVLEQWQLFWRDVASAAGAAAGRDRQAGAILNLDYAEPIARLARDLALGPAVGALRLVGGTIKAIQQNANTRLALDALLLQLPR